MHVVTPGSLADQTGSKYLGVLVSAKYARAMNEFRRNQLSDEVETGEYREKLTTTAVEAVARGDVEFDLVARRRPVDL